MFSSFTMRSSTAVASVLVALVARATAINVIMSNDDGWASCNIRASYKELGRAGFNVRFGDDRAARFAEVWLRSYSRRLLWDDLVRVLWTCLPFPC